ncbi:hypothetical protein LCGC14_0252140 [marine sediment metagenome]|uniref:Uncharacterized protein n=1 Tax=marine sediment metagenome TaxID=412755 RepID=A0A0F9UL16_9ZZZZ
MKGLARLEHRRRCGRLWTWNRAAGTSYEITLEEREALRDKSRHRASRARAKNHRNYTSRQET